MVDRNGFADHLDGVLTTSRLIRDHPEQVQAVCVLGIDGQNLAIDPLSLGLPARSVVLKSISEYARNHLRRALYLPRCSIVMLREPVIHLL